MLVLLGEAIALRNGTSANYEQLNRFLQSHYHRLVNASIFQSFGQFFYFKVCLSRIINCRPITCPLFHQRPVRKIVCGILRARVRLDCSICDR